MTDTTPDYARLSRHLGALAYHIQQTGTADSQDAQTCLEVAEALRTLLERNKELELMLRSANSMQQKTSTSMTDWVRRAEAAEARVAELEDLCNSLEAQAMGLAYDLKRAEDKLAEAMKVIERLTSYIQSPLRVSRDEDEQNRRDDLIRAARALETQEGEG